MNAGMTAPHGELTAKLVRGPRHEVAPLDWRIRNAMRPAYLQGWLGKHTARLLTKILPVMCITAELRAMKKNADGGYVDYGVISRKVVTTVGAGFIVDAFQNLVELENMKYHGVGTGGTAEAAGDTALVTETTTQINPDSTRATGVNAESSATVMTSIATVTFDGTAAITEHGLFSQAATGGGVLFDRSLFAAINVVNLDSIQFTYSLTIAAGS